MFSVLVVLQAGLNHQLKYIQIWTTHTLTSLLYMLQLQHISEKHPSSSYPTAKLSKHNQLRVSRIRDRQTSDIFSRHRAGRCAREGLLIQVHMQKSIPVKSIIS